VHELFSCAPRPELQTYIRAFAQRRTERESPEVVEPMPACLEVIVDFQFGSRPIAEFGDASLFKIYEVGVLGPSAYRPINLHLPGGVESFGIFFQPLAFWQLFHLPMSLLVNRDYDGYDVLGLEARSLWHKMAETDNFISRVKLAEEYLLGKVVNSRRNSSIMNAALYMFKSKGVVRVNDVARHTSLGLRQFERNFIAEIGLAPKLYSRVARFESALDAKINCKNVRWVDLACEFGYHDQMHMIRDFQKLSGLSPEYLLGRLGDIRPPAQTTLAMNMSLSEPSRHSNAKL
jgi:AraC-like DNA-binding protein